jgi:hypothetical protein
VYAEFYQTFKKELKPTLFNFFHKMESNGTLPNTFYKVSIMLIPEPDKDIFKKELQAILLNEHQCKNPQ